MNKLSSRQIIIIVLHSFILWILCGATIAIGRSLVSMELTLVIHAIGAPVFASIITMFYYKKFNYTTPLQTAIFFLLFVIIMDAGLVAPVFEKSYDMFKSLLGTWIPFCLIFLSTYRTALLYKSKNSN